MLHSTPKYRLVIKMLAKFKGGRGGGVTGKGKQRSWLCRIILFLHVLQFSCKKSTKCIELGPFSNHFLTASGRC